MKMIRFCLIVFIVFVLSCNNKENNNFNSEDLNYEKVQRFTGFYFISEFGGKFNLMYYDFIEDTIKKIFFSKSENVIEVENNFLNNSTFFITAKRLNKRTYIPEYEGIKLYHYDLNTSKLSLINNFSPSIEIYSFWIDINRYKIIRVYFDDIVASYINKHSLIYNPFGKLLSEENQIFDLIKSGYPVREFIKFSENSIDKRFKAIFTNDSLLVFSKEKNKFHPVLERKKIIDLIWTENNKYLIIHYENTSTGDINISIYDLIKNKIVRNFDNKGIKNFICIGNYLIFDYTDNGVQKISIFNFDKMLNVDNIFFGKNSYLKKVSLR